MTKILHNHAHGNCEELLAQLNDYAAGELDAELCHTLNQHLAECPDCQVVLDTLTQTISLYRALHESPDVLPDDVEARLIQRLRLKPACAE
jgi:predicted anti-sigma-YlaC factor YlaD